MKDFEATETAYKNGYSKGYEDAKKDLADKIRKAAKRTILSGERDFFICSDGYRTWDQEEAVHHEVEFLLK